MKEQSTGVSPVIGVILMVALVVGLATLVSVIGFNIGDEPSESPDATVKLDSTGDSVEVSVLRNENVEEIYVTKDGNKIDVSSSVGTNKNIRRGSGSYKIVAVTSDGSEQVIKEKDFSNVNDVETLTGSVKINPDIPGATVEALDSSGTVIGTTTTDQDGSYTFNQQGVDRVRAVAKNIKPSDLSDPSVISHPLYASSIKQNKTGRVNFDFGASNVLCTASIDGNDRTIVLDKGVNGKLQIGNIHQLQAIGDCGLDEDYKLISDIDASVTSSWNGDDGFEPIGDPSNPFTGTLDGQEYTIDGLYIDRPSTVNVGLIGKNNGLVEKIIFTNSDITGDSYVGTVVGNNEDGSVENVDNSVGSLIGSENSNTGHLTAPQCSTINYEESGISSDPYKISNDYELQCMSKDLDGHYIITSDIDATKTDQWNGGSGFNPIGDSSNPFTGALDGQGYEVQGLFIDRSKNRVGLLGYTGGSVPIDNVGLTNVNMNGNGFVGGLVGEYNGGEMTNSYVTGNINANSNSYAGGLVGNAALEVNITGSYAEADVTGDEQQVGGLVGGSDIYPIPFDDDKELNIIESYSTGNVSGNEIVGGIIGYHANGRLENSYATGDVNGNQDVGGLIGSQTDSDVTNSYWDKDSTGQLSSSGGGTKLTTSEMQGSSASTNMAGFDFTNTWDTVSGDYPELSYQP